MNDQDIEQAIQAKGLTAPRVTPAHIKALMDRIVYTFDVRPNGSTTTLAHAFLDGNFYLATGVSACVSVENFDAELGKDIAIAGAKAAAEDKLWELEGYALRERLAAPPSIALTPAEVQSGLDRVRFAEGLIRQLPADHDGRNTWLLNYGQKDENADVAPVSLVGQLEALSKSFEAKTSPEQWLLDQVSDLAAKAKAGGVHSGAPDSVTENLLSRAMGWIEILEQMLDAEPDSIVLEARNSKTGEEAEFKLSDFKDEVAAAIGVVADVEELGDEEGAR